MPANFFRIAVLDPATVVKVNGIVQTGLINNFYYQIGQTSTPNVIEADKPIMVAQYITSADQCGNTALGSDGDPEVIYLSPVEQNIDKVIINSTSNYAITKHYLNVVIPNGGTALSSFKIDGISPSASFIIHPQNAAYSYLVQNLSAGQHTIESDSSFNAIAYGYGNAESYGYNAGANVKDLYQFVSVKNEYATVDFPATCRNSPFYFSMTFPYQPLQIKWAFSGLFADTTIDSPTYDSTWFIMENNCINTNFPILIPLLKSERFQLKYLLKIQRLMVAVANRKLITIYRCLNIRHLISILQVRVAYRIAFISLIMQIQADDLLLNGHGILMMELLLQLRIRLIYF
jgi:hypothetical protein